MDYFREERPEQEFEDIRKDLKQRYESGDEVLSQRDLAYIRRDRKLAKLISAIKDRQKVDPQVVEKPVNNKVVINPPESTVESYLPRLKNILK